ncbi:isoprenylcysteine carboxyl methyltransferase family protein [Bradyrhizobium sp. STM 3562]|uniref:isoprenylcysteine carboxyl methyltransferase family protein n=1 Tax=Bradyrhizobium sp. STM 3562 TaxID=578924 RepID=UPI00388D02B3
MSAAAIILALVTLQRLGELMLSRRNTKRLLARGAIEVGARHYPFIVAVHVAWLIALWMLGRNQQVDWLLLAAFVVLQGLRLWILSSLGSRWTTRIIVVPGEPLIASGPYRYVSHPNYAVVAGEIALLPLALHLPSVALLFSVLNGIALFIRIRTEARALATFSRPFARAVP